MKILLAIEGYWLSKKRLLSQNTVNDYTLTFRRLVEFLSERQEFEAITTHQVRLFLNHLQTEYALAPKSMANVWIALSSLWTWAGTELGTEHVLSGKIERPRWRRPPIEPYTMTDVQAMLEAASYTRAWRTKTGRLARTQRPTALRDRAIILTLIDTGLRASELCDLRIEDYESASGRLFVRKGKGSKGRLVYAGATARKALWKYLASRAGHDGGKQPLFATANHTHLGRSELRHMVQGCAARASVTGSTVHKFRHTFAITFLRNGGNVLELKELLGHEKMETVQIYAKLAQVDLQAAQARASPADNWDLR